MGFNLLFRGKLYLPLRLFSLVSAIISEVERFNEMASTAVPKVDS